MKNNLKSSIIRVQKNKDNPYLMLNKECINDDRLSWSAKGLHTYLLGLPDNWKIYVSELIKHTSSGETNTRSAIKELLTYGYMERFQYRCKGVVVSGEYVVHETPIKFDGDNTKTKIIKVERNDNGEYIEITTSKPDCENLNLDTPNSDFTPLLNNNKLNNNKLNNNFEDEEKATPEQQLINLYKSFKLEKRVMPHTLKLLKDNVHISLDVFEQLFINAISKDSIYRYLQEVLKDLNTNNITTLEEFNKHLDARKCKSTKGSNKEKAKTNNKFKNFTETFTNYSENELNTIIDKSQDEKFKINNTKNNNNNENDLINKAIELLQAETVLIVNPNDRYWADEIKKKVQELKGL